MKPTKKVLGSFTRVASRLREMGTLRSCGSSCGSSQQISRSSGSHHFVVRALQVWSCRHCAGSETARGLNPSCNLCHPCLPKLQLRHFPASFKHMQVVFAESHSPLRELFDGVKKLLDTFFHRRRRLCKELCLHDLLYDAFLPRFLLLHSLHLREKLRIESSPPPSLSTFVRTNNTSTNTSTPMSVSSTSTSTSTSITSRIAITHPHHRLHLFFHLQQNIHHPLQQYSQ